MWWRNYDNTLGRFHTIPERNGRTERRTTDRFATIISRVSMLTRDKNRGCASANLLKTTAIHHLESITFCRSLEAVIFRLYFLFYRDLGMRDTYTDSVSKQYPLRQNLPMTRHAVARIFALSDLRFRWQYKLHAVAVGTYYCAHADGYKDIFTRKRSPTGHQYYIPQECGLNWIANCKVWLLMYPC